jgi:hypothetical protein
MLALQKMRSLDLKEPSQEGRKPHLSAASGLVRAGKKFYVVADDELSLGVFDHKHEKPGELIRLLPGELSLDPVERKAAKADFESLVALPAFSGFEHGALFALGSGSKKKKRHTGAVLRLGADGKLIEGAQAFELAAMYEPLHSEFEKLNIEGAVVFGEEFRLFQRGNKKDRMNAIVCCKLKPVIDALSMRQQIPALELISIVPVELGELDGIPLSFTDAAGLPNGDMVFTAAAEDTDDAYADGPFTGSAVGIVRADGNLTALERCSEKVKLEGVAVAKSGDAIELLLVSDADDADIAAGLYHASLKAGA